MTEKLCLQWNDFQENLKSAFGSLREDNDFVDVTLACEDGQQVEAHKVILAASSPFFQKLLGRNKHPHPLIYMRGMKYEDLLAIVDFLYHGEANVHQENLDSFLAIAEELQLKGLMGKTDENVENTHVDQKYAPPENIPNPNKIARSANIHTKLNNVRTSSSDRALAVSNYFSGNLDELDERVMSMMERSVSKLPNRNRQDVCKVCGKEGERTSIKDHIEANHIEGILIPCNLCNKSFRSRNALRLHMRQHKKTLIDENNFK